MRTYADFARRSPVPEREDGKLTTSRNSPPLVNATLDRPGGLLLHFDAEFSTLEDLIAATFTGRNLGWLPGQKAAAMHHIATVVRDYRGSAFGFASRNFYAEFLAALDVSERAGELFGELPHIPAVQGEEIAVPHAMGLQYAARLAGVSAEDLVVANPAFLPGVTGGRVPIPRGYQLRVPPGGDPLQVARAEAPPRPEHTQVAARSRSVRPVQLASAKSTRGSTAAKGSTASAKSSTKKAAVGTRRVVPELRLRMAPIRGTAWRGLIALSGMALLSQISDVVDSQWDKVLLSRYVGSTAVAGFQVGTSLALQAKASGKSLNTYCAERLARYGS
jgi:hypothetical protein